MSSTIVICSNRRVLRLHVVIGACNDRNLFLASDIYGVLEVDAR